MINPRLLPIPGPTDSVTYTIKVAGRELPNSLSLFGLTVCQEVARIPTASLVISDGDPGKQDFEVSNEGWFVPGNVLEIFLGYRSDEELIFKGVIINHRITVRNGSSSLEIDCRDAAYRMTLRRNSQYFYEQTDSSIARQLIETYQLEHEVEETATTHAQLVQFDCSDWDFLMTRMEVNGLISLVQNGKLIVKPPNFGQQPALAVSYGATIVEFDGDLEVRDQFAQVSAQAWDYSSQELLELSATEPTILANGNLPANKISASNDSEPNILRHGGAIDNNELQAWADARILKDRLSRTRGRVQIHGYSGILPGQLLELSGFGDRFNGPVFVAGVRHELHQGLWLTDIEFGLSPKWFSEEFPVDSPPAALLIPPVSGLQIGIVTQIHEDPQGEFRIQVRCPIIDHTAVGIWARIATLEAGENSGFFFLPEVDDEVIVGFINDDPREAIVLGMLHSRTKAAPFTASLENLEKGYVSRSGLRLIFHETDGSICLKTPEDNQLLISDEGQGITLADQHGNKIVMDQNGITLESRKDIKVKAGRNYQADVKGNWKAKAVKQGEITASQRLQLKSTRIDIN